jgi:hypothetical protein
VLNFPSPKTKHEDCEFSKEKTTHPPPIKPLIIIKKRRSGFEGPPNTPMGRRLSTHSYNDQNGGGGGDGA